MFDIIPFHEKTQGIEEYQTVTPLIERRLHRVRYRLVNRAAIRAKRRLLESTFRLGANFRAARMLRGPGAEYNCFGMPRVLVEVVDFSRREYAHVSLVRMVNQREIHELINLCQANFATTLPRNRRA